MRGDVTITYRRNRPLSACVYLRSTFDESSRVFCSFRGQALVDWRYYGTECPVSVTDKSYACERIATVLPNRFAPGRGR